MFFGSPSVITTSIHVPLILRTVYAGSEKSTCTHLEGVLWVLSAVQLEEEQARRSVGSDG